VPRFSSNAAGAADFGKSLGHYRWISIRSMSRVVSIAQSGSRSGGTRCTLESSRLLLRGRTRNYRSSPLRKGLIARCGAIIDLRVAKFPHSPGPAALARLEPSLLRYLPVLHSRGCITFALSLA